VLASFCSPVKMDAAGYSESFMRDRRDRQTDRHVSCVFFFVIYFLLPLFVVRLPLYVIFVRAGRFINSSSSVFFCLYIV
jgi:hypothetical protein